MNEPICLTKSIVETIHFSQIREHGGQYGIRDINLLESALARPINRWVYEQESDIVILAAAYGYGLAKNHCFIDGNKRVAFMAMYTFLGLNGYEIEATEPEVVDLMLGVADSRISEEQLIHWLRIHVVPDGNYDTSTTAST
ncbi:MAG: type II toxin-antitoxin system death-on-curing family toxin [Dethiobacter sp.]|jgi:death-on-curing protein|nr:type II toxin-antitoxin system death-on-curing family toxin [Dethiobacter sp.]MBS4022648.1 type II toxin-antitoxin system death-on-curing family toxin [Dethiobacter sp.]